LGFKEFNQERASPDGIVGLVAVSDLNSIFSLKAVDNFS
jgi:hypothetical protein